MQDAARELPKVVSDAQESRPILDRLPVGILVYRLNSLIYANRAFLEWTGYATLDALNEAGGLDSLAHHRFQRYGQVFHAHLAA